MFQVSIRDSCTKTDIGIGCKMKNAFDAFHSQINILITRDITFDKCHVSTVQMALNELEVTRGEVVDDNNFVTALD